MQLSAILSDLQALGYGTDTQTQQIQFINDTYREVHSKLRWPFLEAQSSSLVTVVGTNAYALPGDMSTARNIDAVRLQITAIQDYINLEYKDPQTFRDNENIDRDIGTPCAWSYFNQQLHLWPYPDDVYTVVIDYINQPADLVNMTDVPVMPASYHDVLVWGAARSMAFRERDWLGRQFAQSEFESRLTRMEEEYMVRQRQSGSHVKKSGHWSTSVQFPFIPIR